MKKAFGKYFILIVSFVISCSAKPEQRTGQAREGDLSANSLVQIHERILQPTCAASGCHDGHFEPDFRTPQSAFYTTVFHPVTKNNVKMEFEFRVIPGDRKKSVLYERITNCCFVNKDDRMPQDNIAVPLPDDQIEAIGKWIDEGAKNIDGLSMKNPFNLGGQNE